MSPLKDSVSPSRCPSLRQLSACGRSLQEWVLPRDSAQAPRGWRGCGPQYPRTQEWPEPESGLAPFDTPPASFSGCPGGTQAHHAEQAWVYRDRHNKSETSAHKHCICSRLLGRGVCAAPTPYRRPDRSRAVAPDSTVEGSDHSGELLEQLPTLFPATTV